MGPQCQRDEDPFLIAQLFIEKVYFLYIDTARLRLDVSASFRGIDMPTNILGALS